MQLSMGFIISMWPFGVCWQSYQFVEPGFHLVVAVCDDELILVANVVGCSLLTLLSTLA